MASEIKLPALGENVTGGSIVDIRVSQGDVVREGQPLVEVEAEKSNVEVPSPLAGRIAKVLVKRGDQVETGQPLFVVEAVDGKEQQAAKPDATKPDAKADVTRREAPASAEKARPAESPVPPAPPAPSGPRPSGELVPAGPATRRLARELGIDLAAVSGSASFGRVTQDDVKTYVRNLATGAGRSQATAGVAPPPLPNFEQWGAVERRPFESIRRRTAEHVSLAWSLIPHVTHHDLADVTELEGFRKQQGDNGPKITVTAFALKAAAIALREFPHINASLDLAAGQLILKRYYHIGVAVDTERGLLVPVVRDVDNKSVHELARELGELAERARHKKLSVDDMKGGTFTISNLGGIGGTAFTPIINYPEAAILGLSRARLQPVFKDGQFVPRLLLPVSLSYDHRIIDGADAARFSRRLAELLENPLVMLLHA